MENAEISSTVRWEKFLPRKHIRVLLVEHDDSTRHVVAALLRKCSYNVVGVADGMKAWEVMKEREYGFDIVLAEVATPSMSGIGLLGKVVGCEECKNIPVIMMSSHDSVRVVLKCMLKGAVDFLVKPVRKNELRNLWQHVWRRHCSSSYMDASDNNTVSNQFSADADRSKTGENSDAQSSGSKPDMEFESAPKCIEPSLAEDGGFTREEKANAEQVDNDRTILANASKMDDNDETRGYKPIGVAGDATLPIEESSVAQKSPDQQNRSSDISQHKEVNLDPLRTKERGYNNPKSYCKNNAPSELLQEMVVSVEPINGQCSYSVLEKDAPAEDGLSETAKSSHEKDASNLGSLPSWDLSFRRPHPNGCVQPEFKEKHVLKHSNASAFSRYSDKGIYPSYHKSISPALCIRTKECGDKGIDPSRHKSVLSALCFRTEECAYKNQLDVSNQGTDNGRNTPVSPPEKTQSTPLRNEGEAMMYFQVSSNSKDTCSLLTCPRGEDARASHSSTVEETVPYQPQFRFIPLPIPVGAVPYQSLCAGYGPVLQPTFYLNASLVPQSSAAVEKPMIQLPSDQPGHHSNQVYHSLSFHHHEETHQPHHWRQAVDITAPGDPRDFSSHSIEQVYQSGSCSEDALKGSGSNGSGEAVDGAGNAGAPLESGNESGVQNCNSTGLDCVRSRREAALMKFRLKRKDRCFEKKVRYYSRKKLAEQRPRVKGQFVRQKITDSMTTTEADH